MTFGETLKEVRQKQGDSLRGLSSKIDVVFTYIDKIEKGQRSVNAEILEKLIREYPTYKKTLIDAYVKDILPDFVFEEVLGKSEVVTQAIKNLDAESVFEMFFKRLSVEERRELLTNILDKFEIRSYRQGTIEEDKEEIEFIRQKIRELK